MSAGLVCRVLPVILLASACLPIDDDDDDGAEPDVASSEQAVSSSERVVRVALGGHADLSLAFSEFFGSSFTLSAWFQPEFVRAYTGPILAENGTGRFAVGLATSPDSTPVLYLQVGNKTVKYRVRTLAKRTWYHLAVVRSAFTFPTGENTFSLYLDGVKQYPVKYNSGDIENGIYPSWTGVPEIAFSSSDPMTSVPSGNVRIGRRTDTTDASRNWQYFGLVDEVAVYRGRPYVGTLASQRAVVESDALIEGFTFDTVIYSNPKLKHGTTYEAPAEALSPPMIGSVFDLASKVSPTVATYTLPFARGQAWRVVQEFDDTTSHYGESAFCWDFFRVGTATENTPIYAAAPGDVIKVHDSTDDEGYTYPDNWRNQPWKLWTRTGGDEMTTHMHLDDESVEDALCAGNCDPLPQDNGVVIRVVRGQQLGVVGTARDPDNSHLHFALNTVPGIGGAVTIPMAFSDYQLCVLEPGETVSTTADLAKCTWRDVTRGMPRQGQIVRRP